MENSQPAATSFHSVDPGGSGTGWKVDSGVAAATAAAVGMHWACVLSPHAKRAPVAVRSRVWFPPATIELGGREEEGGRTQWVGVCTSEVWARESWPRPLEPKEWSMVRRGEGGEGSRVRADTVTRAAALSALLPGLLPGRPAEG